VAVVRWGILSTAGIGTRQVISAMQRGRHSRVDAIASRDRAKADAVAAQFGIGRSHGSYDDLLADPDVDAVYIPLPNHLHVPWSLRALDAGKHVLCEKPIGLNRAEAETLARAASQHPRLKVMEAFMYRFHPQWSRARELAAGGAIGDVRAMQTWITYFNNDAGNIRNIKACGGGALMDIGCYAISFARFIVGREPARVIGVSERDRQFGTDRLTSAIMDFDGPVATFTCATQLARYQRVEIVGTDGRIEIEIPVNAPADRPSQIWFHQGAKIEEIAFEVCNQYTIQGDMFALAVLDNAPVPTPLDDAVANMRAIDAIRQSAEGGGGWVVPSSC
jgi:predicted dehydrogenase